MEATLLLANSAETSPNGLIYALGLGWSTTGTPTPPAALVILIGVPWDQTNVTHKFIVKLLDADGHAVELGTDPTGAPAGLQIEGQFEVGRPPGVPHGTAIDQPLAIGLAPGMPLAPGGYQWRLEVDGEDVAARSFLVRSSVGVPPGGPPA